MTENRAPHLSDEWLSAHLDAEDSGSGDLEHERHLASCESCTARLGALRAAKLLVSAPVGSPSADSRSRAISAALTAFDDDSPKGTNAGDIEKDVTTPQRIAASQRRWYRRQPVLVGAAAAVILALAVTLPLILTGKGPGMTSAARSQQRSAPPTHAASPGAAGSSTAGAAGSAAASGGVGTTPSVLPDLGTVTSKQELISRVRALGPSYQGAPAAPSASNSPGASGSGGSASELPPSFSVANCVTHTQDETGAHYGPGEVATVTYDGQRAIVMELWKSASTPAAGADEVAVATEGNCKLLLTATF